jgi:DNA-binding GntR family transcriptional regulator
MTDDYLTKLEELVVLLERPMNTERERQQHERKNNEFHLRIVELSRNRKLIDIYNNLNSHMKMARVHYTSIISPQRVLEERREHRRILKALIARDPSALSLALNDHISRAAALLVDDLKKAEKDQGAA